MNNNERSTKEKSNLLDCSINHLDNSVESFVDFKYSCLDEN